MKTSIWSAYADINLLQVKRGVKFGEGDGTVPLLSLGAMSVRGWTEPRWNPAGIKVITKGWSAACGLEDLTKIALIEFKHEPEALDLRGGARTWVVDRLTLPVIQLILALLQRRSH